MGLILKVRTCLKPLKPFIHQGAFYTLKTPLCKSPALPLSARLLCTRDTDRWSGGQRGVKNGTIRRREGELWDDAVTGRGKSFTLRQKPSFPKSVFTAGTAKRTAEMLKRKAALVSQDEEEAEGRTARGAGRTYWSYLRHFRKQIMCRNNSTLLLVIPAQ